MEHCSQSYADKDHDNKQVGQNAEKGAKHGHLRVTMGQGTGGRGAVVYDDELLSASRGGLIQESALTLTHGVNCKWERKPM